MNSFQLKMIAILSMTIDHIGAVFFPEVLIFRYIGRLAFPIFAYFVAEGMYHTKDLKRYFIRLMGFALITEVIFDMTFYGSLFYPGHQNILFTFSIVVIAKMVIVKLKVKDYYLYMLVVFVFMMMAQLLRTDYGAVGVLLVFIFHYYRDNKRSQFGMAAVTLGVFGVLETKLYIVALLAMPLIYMFNGERGLRLKYLFYGFYPLHLAAIYLVHQYII